jgi:hypothetical protein
MKIIIVAFIASLALAGCVQTTASVPAPVAPVTVPASKLSALVKRTCGVVLTARSLAWIVGTVSPATGDLVGYASQVCAALQGAGVYASGTFQGRRIVGIKVR